MGWQDGEIVEPPARDAPWARDPIAPPPGFVIQPDTNSLRRYFEPHKPRAAQSFTDYIEAGFQQSVTGLVVRGKAPEVAIDSESPWYGRIASMITGIFGDVPAIIPGALAGGAFGSAVAPGPGTVVGAWGGGGALPAGLRAALIESYTKGEVQSSTDFIERALHVAWETAKGGAIGAATGGAGVLAKGAIPAVASPFVKGAGVAASEIATLATVGAALEGRLPEWQEFVDAGVLIGGARGGIAIARKVAKVYEKTGIPPVEVITDALSDPATRAELTSPDAEIPRAYQPMATAETVRAVVPDPMTNERHALNIAAVLTNVEGKITESKQPNYINFRYLESADDVKAVSARISEIFEKEIAERREAPKGWDESMGEARRALTDAAGGDFNAIQRGALSLDAEVLAKNAMLQKAASDVAERARIIREKGTAATAEDMREQIAAIEILRLVQAEALGNAAEVGRALNAMKAARQVKELAGDLGDLFGKYGSDPHTLARMIGELDNVSQIGKFTREVAKASTWEKVIEAWKAGLLSGPLTHMRNILGNTSFMIARPVIDASAAAFGAVRRAPIEERVALMEPVARIIGNLQGTIDAAKLAGAVLKMGEEPGKSEQFRPAIEGTKGEVIRVPFRLLSAADAFFRTVNERGEAYTLAVRQATAEGRDPLTREYLDRVTQLVQEPTPAMAGEIAAAGLRFTFNTPFKETGRAAQTIVRKLHLEFLFPFIRTPANILRETARLTPLAPIVESWRQDFAKGGAARDKALAEIGTGTAFMGAIFMAALNGNVTGAGEPESGKRRVNLAAGWQPYSVKIGSTYYSYQGWGPITTLLGIAADSAEVWDHMGDDERNDVSKMIAVAFANAVTNQTALMGMTNLVNVTSDPTRYGPTFFNSMAGSLVPALIAQPTTMLDPVVRHVDGMLDAVKARVPGFRQSLLAKRDIFGDQIATKERLGGLSPVTETTDSTDKVRTEMARLGLSAADTPKKTHIGRGTGKTGEVKLEPAERDRFAEVSGKLAHEVLAGIVNGPTWDDLPDEAQRTLYRKVFAQAHKAGAAAALPLEKRLALAQEITEKAIGKLSD